MFEFWTGAPGQEDLALYGFLIRAFIVYVYIFLIVKVVGQRSMGSIDALDFIFAIVIGDVLGNPLTDGNMSISGPIVAAGLIAGLHLTLSIISLHMPRFRRIIEDEPIILMKDGQILHNQLRKTKVTLESFLMSLRAKNASDLNEVDYAILEMNGSINVIKKSMFESATVNDLNKTVPSKGYPSVLIADGKIIEANVNKVGNLDWLYEQVLKKGHKDVKDIFLMTINEAGKIYVSPKHTKNMSS